MFNVVSTSSSQLDMQRGLSSARIRKSVTPTIRCTKYDMEDYQLRSAIGDLDGNILQAEISPSETFLVTSWQARIRLQIIWWLAWWNIIWPVWGISFGWIFWPCDDGWYCSPSGFMRVIDILLEVIFLLAVICTLFVSRVNVMQCKEYNRRVSVLMLTIGSPLWWMDIGCFFMCCMGYIVPTTFPYVWIFRLLRGHNLFNVMDNRALRQDALNRFGAEAIAYLLISVLVFAHLFACLWFLVVQSAWIGTRTDFLAHIEERSVREFDIGPNPQVLRGEPYLAYEWSLHWAIQATASLSGPMSETAHERLCLTFLIPIGSMFMGLVLSRMLVIVHALTLMSSEADQDAQYLECAMKGLDLPDTLKRHISRFHNFSVLATHNSARNRLNSCISWNTKCELQICLFQGLINNAPFFQSLQPTAILDIIMKLEVNVFGPGDIVIRKGDVGTSMYFVMSGHIEVTGSVSGDPLYATKQAGDFFGEVALVLDAPRTAWVRSRTYSQLSKTSLDEVFVCAPSQKEIILGGIKTGGLADSKNLCQQRPSWVTGALPMPSVFRAISCAIARFKEGLRRGGGAKVSQILPLQDGGNHRLNPEANPED